MSPQMVQSDGERIAALEIEVRVLNGTVDKMEKTVGNVRDLLQQGRGAVRLVYLVLSIIGALGLSALFGHRIQDFFMSLGR